MKKIRKAGVCGLLAGTMLTAMLSGCGGEKKVDGTAPALTINGETVSMGTAEFYLRFQQAETTTMLMSYGMLQEGGSFWDGEYAAATSSQEAETYGDSMKDSVKDALVEGVLLRQHFGDYDLTFPEDLEKQASEAAAATMTANAEAMEKIGVTEENVLEALKLMAYQPVMFDAVTADTDTEVSDEEAAQTTITLAQAFLKTTDSETNTQTDMDDAQKEELHTEMSQLIESIREADDPEADVSAIAATIDAENITVSSRSFGSDDTILADEVKEAVSDLEDGQVYEDVIDTGDYYYVVRLDKKFDEEKTEQKKESIVRQRLQDAFTAKLDSWKEAAEITEEEAWKALKVTDTDAYIQKIPEEESTSESAVTESADTESTAESADAESTAESADAESIAESADAESTPEPANAESKAQSAAAESTASSSEK